jgi:phage shock protein A
LQSEQALGDARGQLVAAEQQAAAARASEALREREVEAAGVHAKEEAAVLEQALADARGDLAAVVAREAALVQEVHPGTLNPEP